MIQRIQTLWLLLAAGCNAITLLLPFYTGVKEKDVLENVTAQSNFILLILCVAVILSSLLSIFFYKDRKKQMMIVAIGFVLQILNIILLLKQMSAFKEGTVSLSSLFSFAVPVFFVMALIGIRKDEKLIKSMDRLR